MDEYLCFIDYLGRTIEGNFIYRFDFTRDKETLWGEYFNVAPTSLMPNLQPDESQLSHRGKIETEIEFNLAKKNGCYSMQDCIDGILPLAFPDLKEEYISENSILKFDFGETLEEVEEKLNNLNLKFIDFEATSVGDDSIIDDLLKEGEGETAEEIKERVEFEELIDRYNDEDYEEEDIDNEFVNEEEGVLVYIKHLYDEPDGTFVYQFFFSTTPDDVWGINWDICPPYHNGDLAPDETTYEHVYKIHSKYKFKTIEETSCYTMEHAIYNAIALGWIDIEGLDEYPEHGRSVFHFGDNLPSVSIKIRDYDGYIEKGEE